jgi:hypothetical protein
MGTKYAGPAIVRLRGEEYAADHAELAEGVVTFVGRLRVCDLTGERFYAPVNLSHRLAAGEEIEWLAEPQAAAA